jgi:GDP-L-fucose synthase
VGSAIKRKLNYFGYNNLICPDRNSLDLTNNNAVSKWYKKHNPDIIILAAAKVGGIYANNSYPANFILDNIKIQTNVIEGAWKNEAKRLLFLGSSCIYPRDSKQPIKEETLLTGNLEETNQWYAIAKISGIKLCQALRIQYGFDAISLMPTNLYGKGDNYHKKNSHVLPALLDRFHNHALENKKYIKCWGTGNPRREFMHVDDLAFACLFALENWDPFSSNAPLDEKGSPLTLLNVGWGQDISIKELARLISTITSFEGEIMLINLASSFIEMSCPHPTFNKVKGDPFSSNGALDEKGSQFSKANKQAKAKSSTCMNSLRGLPVPQHFMYFLFSKA